ncbi:hypothetical protein F5I97DRAFT_1578059 [Phlebopus sp. FC_14]|nr:hypothetical protein F5I97DRAFT_1578059 [Phlebopus sp. FC_14]
MDVGLPRETQQIDRVIEAFANRYFACNPDLFTSSDQPYILAFSLIMLHTDAFNRSNRRKMTKTDYVKNTSLPGLIPEVLACFYDNIVFAPFIYIEDPLDANGGGNHDGGSARPSTSSGLPSPMAQPGNVLLSKPKIDPYYLITHNLLHQLRVSVEDHIPLENPYRWDGTGASWNYDEILLTFAKGHVIEIASTDSRLPSAFFGLAAGGMPSPSLTGVSGIPDLNPTELWSLKLTKIAVLNRKDDLLEGGKKPLNRKWRSFSVALTESQLLLCRDLSWASMLLSWDSSKRVPIQSTMFKPDEVISLNNVLAVFDRSYTKHLNTFRLTIPDGRHILFQTQDENETNEWIARINYASAFKTAGVKMRPLGMSEKDVELTGVAAATSHLHDLQLTHRPQPRLLTWDHRASDSSDESTGDAYPLDASDHVRNATNSHQNVEMYVPSVPEVEGASQFKETFDTVKAELAAACTGGVDFTAVPGDRVVFPGCSIERSRPSSPTYLDSARSPPRSRMIHSRVQDLEARICAVNAQIDSNLHRARNIAVLVPFQKSTRDRLQDVIQNLSRQIQSMRLSVTRLICHRNIMLNDLAAEERGFKTATALALQAAAETLENHRLKSTFHIQDIHGNSSSQEGSSRVFSHSFESSIGDSFRSALDFGPDWPSNGEAFAAATLLETRQITESPVTEAGENNSTGCYPSPDTNPPLSETVNASLPDIPTYENSTATQGPAEEQAEEWNKTRAAKRVSLVRVPSDLRLSMLGRSSRHHPAPLLNLREETYVDVDFFSDLRTPLKGSS